jgi:hypothetical protein
MAERRKAQPPLATQDAGDPLAEVEAMLVRLTELRQREANKDRRADYGAAIDRLHALAYRLIEARPSRTIGLSPRRSAPVPERAPAPAPPQRTLPLGPVVVTRRPKRR